MTSPQEQDDLDEYEEGARGRLGPVLGPLRVVDVRGGPQEGLHDFEADLADGTAAIEVTSEVDGQRRGLSREVARRGLVSFEADGLTALWLVSLTTRANVKALSRTEELRRLLTDLEDVGRTSALDIGDSYHDPFVERLRALGIESAAAVTPKSGREGTVMVRPGSYGGFGWDGSAIDAWLDELLASDRGINKIRKLGRADASERHLVTVLDPFSPAGMGIPLALNARHERGAAEYGLPSIAPPEPLSHVWLMPMMWTSEALLWKRGAGWAIMELR